MLTPSTRTHARETFYDGIIEAAIIVNTPTYFLIKLLFKTSSRTRKTKSQAVRETRIGGEKKPIPAGAAEFLLECG